MKKLFKNVLFLTILFIILFIIISYILGLYNYQFLNWIKCTIMIISLIGIFVGTIQSLIKKRVLCIIICILEFIIIIICTLFLIILYNKEDIVIKDKHKMLKETHSVLLSNWVKYYDYKNIFIRSRQERIYVAYDDSLGEYLYTIYYDKSGNVIKRDE